MSFHIIGTGSKVPEYKLSNDQLSSMMDTSDEWITSRTGIKNRHILTEESLTRLASEASLQALEQANCQASEIDLIICATMQGDHIVPSLACMIQKEIKATCPAFDVNAACTGFIFALDIAAGYFARGHVKKVLVVAAEAVSRHVDWQDRSTSILFGDAAGAVVLSAGDQLLAVKLTAEGNDDFLKIDGNKGNFPLLTTTKEQSFIEMNGQEVYKFAVQAICHDIEDVLQKAKITASEVDYVLIHQANARILEAGKSKLSIAADKFISNIDRYGNTSSASIPIMLDELNRQGKLYDGALLVFSAFGAGFTTGATVIRW